MSTSPSNPGPDGFPARWPLVASEPGPDLMVCRARFDVLTNPRTGRDLRRTVLETPDWVNVVALTPERRLVFVRQYRFGNAALTLEIPGGVVDRGEDPADAARRELREEAGYTSEHWRPLGAVEPNPAFHDNLCHHWLALDARRTTVQELDEGEDIEVLELELDDVRWRIADGEIRHALVLTALSKVLDLRGGEVLDAGNEGSVVGARSPRCPESTGESRPPPAHPPHKDRPNSTR